MTDDKKRYNRAAQDVLNLLKQTLVECGVRTLPEHFVKKMTKNRIAALIEVRMNEGKLNEALQTGNSDSK